MRFLLFVVLSLQLFAVDATLTIVKDVEQRARISLVDGSSQSALTQKFFNTMLSDLKISGHFLPDMKHHLGGISNNTIDPKMKSKDIVMKYTLVQSAGLKVVVKLFKASNSSLIATKDYSISSVNKFPFLAHKVVSEINTLLGFPEVNWLNRYVVFSRYTGAKKSVIILADYTMQYQKSVIRGGLNLFPKWADSQQRSFYYTSFNGTLPTLYRLNIYNGSKSKITSSQGMLVCSDVNKNGSKILLTMAPNGQADIYEMSLSSRSTRRVTNFAGIDVGGKYLNGGSSIAFVSNRLGYANIYKTSLSGGSVTQLVSRGKNNNAVDTNDDKVVYSSRESSSAFGANSFNLYLTNSSGSSIKVLTTTGINQFPRFSANGDTILYVKHQNNRSSIGYINLASKQNMLFPLGGKVQSIDW